jgi:predicted RNase H-like HicB family nuclease
MPAIVLKERVDFLLAYGPETTSISEQHGFATKRIRIQTQIEFCRRTTIKAVIRSGEQSGFVAECLEIPVVTQGATMDEVTANLREAVALQLEGEDLAEIGLVASPTIVTFEMEASPAPA